MTITVVIPARNASREIEACLAALDASTRRPDEVVVVDDASTDDTAVRARGAAVVSLAENVGPAAARNRGVAAARGDVLFFVDADVAVHPGTIALAESAFAADPAVAAVFGSYDAAPRAAGVVSQYRNLLHHFVHQQGNPEAFTFWAGCGAVRRAAFEAVGGFDPDVRWRFIEDIELGDRLCRAGHRIRLERTMQATHLKRWTLWSMLRTDLVYRAAPWARLLAERGPAGRDLNLRTDQRASVALVALAGLALALGALRPPLALGAPMALLAVAWLNRPLYRLFLRARGPGFAAACFPLHLLYFACGGLGFVWGRLTARAARAAGPAVA